MGNPKPDVHEQLREEPRVTREAYERHLEESCIRARTEDDDGYDPYQDRIVREPLFERDPWS